MQFNLFRKINGTGEICTLDLFLSITQSDEIKAVAREVAEGNLEAKRRLPAITWQAWFDQGKRKNEFAHSSGLFMLDIDHIDGDVYNYMNRLFDGKSKDELGIVVVHKTPSCHGLRIVARVNPLCPTIATNQKWLADELGIRNFDDVCKDFARMSFLVPFDYFYYFSDSIFKQDETNSQIYFLENPEYESQEAVSNQQSAASGQQEAVEPGNEGEAYKTFEGISIKEIAKRWLQNNGGIPTEGNRNSQLFRLACAMRYICEFDAGRLINNLPDYGLSHGEMLNIIKSALTQKKAVNIPRSLLATIHEMKQEKKEQEEVDGDSAIALNYLLNSDKCIDRTMLPPIFREYADIMPDDFKTPAVMALLPMLGTIGSKLRARYRDGRNMSPSFQVEIEAPAGSGKSFVHTIYEDVMQDVEAMDALNWEKEAEYRERVKQAKNEKKQPKPEKFLIRLTPPTTSVSMLLERISNAQGIHCFSFTDEMKIVIDAMKRGSFGDLRALLRNAFDNAKFGQDYKSDNSTNKLVPIYYNTLHCGTPKVYSKFYNDFEDGTITRVIFCTLPDQFGKSMPVIKTMSATNSLKVRKKIQALNDITMDGDEIRKEETWLTNFDFMNKWARQWCEEKQKLAVKYANREIDMFMRRSAVVGFRAGMIAWYLWGQKTDRQTQAKTIAFSQWVAEYMLWKLCKRFTVEQASNEVPYLSVWQLLGDTFTASDVDMALTETSYKSSAKEVIRKWKRKNLIKKIDNTKFKKL